MSSVVARTVTSSDLSRNGAAVFRAADEGPVEITRRDGETLVLTRKSEREREFTALHIAADLVAASLGPGDVPFVDRLADRFPWMQFLTASGQQQFAEEIVRSARACAALGDFGPFLVELISWRETAASKAAGYVSTSDLDWYDESSAVPHPRD